MLLVTGAVAMTDALTQFDIVDVMGGVVRNLGIGPTALPYLAASFVGAVGAGILAGIGLEALDHLARKR